MPGLCAIVRALDFELVTPFALLVPAAVTGLVLGVVVLAADRAVRRKPAWLLLLVPLLAGQAAGATTLANCLGDPSPPSAYRVKVLGHRVARGKSNTYYLTLDRWGPRTWPEEVKVSSLAYAEVEDGRVVEVVLRSGRLGLAWFRVQV
jgi:hypothetical protein